MSRAYNATFVSVWDGGLKVTSRCCVNKKTRMITEMGENDVGENEETLEILEREYVVVDGDTKEYPAYNVNEHECRKKDAFYYD